MLENMYHVTFADAPSYLASSWHMGNVNGHSFAKQHFFSVDIVHPLIM